MTSSTTFSSSEFVAIPYTAFDVLISDVDEQTLEDLGRDYGPEHLSAGIFTSRPFPVLGGHIIGPNNRFMVPLVCQRFGKPSSRAVYVWFLLDTGSPFTCMTVKTFEAFFGQGNVAGDEKSKAIPMAIQEPSNEVRCQISQGKFSQVNILGVDALRAMGVSGIDNIVWPTFQLSKQQPSQPQQKKKEEEEQKMMEELRKKEEEEQRKMKEEEEQRQKGEKERKSKKEDEQRKKEQGGQKKKKGQKKKESEEQRKKQEEEQKKMKKEEEQMKKNEEEQKIMEEEETMKPETEEQRKNKTMLPAREHMLVMSEGDPMEGEGTRISIDLMRDELRNLVDDLDITYINGRHAREYMEQHNNPPDAEPSAGGSGARSKKSGRTSYVLRTPLLAHRVLNVLGESGYTIQNFKMAPGGEHGASHRYCWVLIRSIEH